MELSEADWRAWLIRGESRERRRASVRRSWAKWAGGLALLVAAAVYADRTPYEVAIRLLVAAGAIVAIFQALQPRDAVRQRKENL